MDPTFVVEMTLTEPMSKGLIQDITAQLKEILQMEVDAVMSEYVMMMINNKKSMSEIQTAMIDFLGPTSSTTFVDWLSGHLKHHLEAVLPVTTTSTMKDEEKPVVVEKPTTAPEPSLTSPKSSGRVVSLKSIKTSMQARKERWGIVESSSDSDNIKKTQSHSSSSSHKRRSNVGEDDLRNLIGKKRHPREPNHGSGDLRQLLGRKKESSHDSYYTSSTHRENTLRRSHRSRSLSEDDELVSKSSKSKSSPSETQPFNSTKKKQKNNGPPQHMNNMYPPLPYGMNPMHMQQHMAMMQHHPPRGFHHPNFPPFPRGPPMEYMMGQPGFAPHFPPAFGNSNGGFHPYPPHYPRGGPARGGRGKDNLEALNNSTAPRSFTNKSWVNPDTVMKDEELKKTEDNDVVATPQSYYQPRYPRGGGGDYYHQPRPRGGPRAPFANKKWVRPGTEVTPMTPMTTTQEQDQQLSTSLPKTPPPSSEDPAQ